MKFELFFAIFLIFSFIKQTREYVFPCYYVYEPFNLKPESIPAFDLCTHIIFIGCTHEDINQTTVNILMKPYNCKTAFRKISDLKLQNPDLKVVFSIATNSKAMHKIVQNTNSMNQYVDSALQIANDFNYDGIDLDWEYPCGEDKYKFTKLLEVFRTNIIKHELNLTLSSAIGAGVNTLKECFDLAGLSKNLDYINIMCYDYNSIYNSKTAYASPLFARPEEHGYDATLNSNYTVHYLIENNVPREKIVLGLNAAGHTYQLADPANQHGFHAPVLGVGYRSGWSSYPQLCELIQTKNGNGVYDEVAEVLYGYYDDQWSNTGDVRSATAKSIWAKKMKLAGVFTWDLNSDDIFNVCGHGVTFPIHRAIRKQLFSNN